MCGGTPKIDTTIQDQMLADAEAARAEEEARKARIEEGTAKIDQTFSGFDDGFFNNYRNNFLDLYQPDLDRQFSRAKDDTSYAFARAGTLKSSMAGEKLADLLRGYNDNKSAILSEAHAATQGLQSNVAQEKSQLISLLNATGDAERAGNEALSRSQMLYQELPRYNPLGELFAGAAAGIGNYYAGQQQQAIYDAYFGGQGRAGGSRIVS